MSLLKWIWAREPIVLTILGSVGFWTGLIFAASAFGHPFTPDQQKVLMMIGTGLAGIVARSQVTPTSGATAPPSVSASTRASLVLLFALVLPLVSCTKPDLPTLLQDAKYGLDAVCVIGQNTLPPVVCADGDQALIAAKAIAEKDGDKAAPAVKALLMDLETRQPQIADWTHWLTAKL